MGTRVIEQLREDRSTCHKRRNASDLRSAGRVCIASYCGAGAGLQRAWFHTAARLRAHRETDAESGACRDMTGDSSTDETLFAELDAGSGGTARVALRGRLNAEAVAEGWARIVERLRRANTSDVQVDASGVSYCDGAGVGLLVELQRLAAANGGRAEITVFTI